MSKFSLAQRRTLTMGMLLAPAASGAAQQPYPNKPIRLPSPNPSGGGGATIQ